MKTHYHGTFPKGVFPIFLNNLTINFSLVIFFAQLEYYASHTLNLSNSQAISLFGAFSSLVFGAAIFGGYLASLVPVLRIIQWSALLCIAGALTVIIPNPYALYIGLGIFTMGFALYSPTINFFLGQLYQPDDLKRASGFTVSYIGINLGATLSSFIGGYLVFNLNLPMPYVFLIGAVVGALGFVLFFLQYRRFNYRPNCIIFEQKTTSKSLIILLLSTAIGSALLSLLLLKADVSNILLVAAGIAVAAWFLFKAWREPNKQHAKNMLILVILIAISVSFWTLYMTSPNLLTQFISTNANHHVLGLFVPTTSFWGFGPFFIIVVGIFLTWFWKKLADHNKDPSDFIKFALALIFIGLGYSFIAFAIHLSQGPVTYTTWSNGHMITTHFIGPVKISAYWIILSYFLQTCGELMIGPVGFAMIGRLSPKQYESTFLGLWQLGMGMGGALSGIYGASIDISKSLTTAQAAPKYFSAFSHLSLVTILLGVATLLIWALVKAILKRSQA